MNKKEFVRRVASVMRGNGVRKPISSPKHVFHISDDEGNKKDFVIKQSDKDVNYTIEDVEAVLDTCLAVIEDTLKHGGSISIQGFGSLVLNYWKPRTTRVVNTDNVVDIEGRHIPKFLVGNNLRLCAKLYDLSLKDKAPDESPPILDEEGETDAD